MKIKCYQIDAFANHLFSGNPAAVCLLEQWLPDALMQKIALENNLSETAFLVKENEGYYLRWFTPGREVSLCGHATLATAYVVFNYLQTELESVTFNSKSGKLVVNKTAEGLQLNFPMVTISASECPELLQQGLGCTPLEVYRGEQIPYYLAILDNESQIAALQPNLLLLQQLDLLGVIISAPGDEVDFVSRFFAPAGGVPEDPVTGSAHCIAAPYWSKRLDKSELIARQLSARGGQLLCGLKNNRVYLTGSAVPYMHGTIELPDELIQ